MADSSIARQYVQGFSNAFNITVNQVSDATNFSIAAIQKFENDYPIINDPYSILNEVGHSLGAF